MSFTFNEDKSVHKYHKKWKDIALCTKRINRKTAQYFVQQLYSFCQLKKPNIYFFSSPHGGLKEAVKIYRKQTFLNFNLLGINLIEKIANQSQEKFTREEFEKFEEFKEVEKIDTYLVQSLENWVTGIKQEKLIYRCLKPEQRCASFCIIDFFIHVLDYPINKTEWKIYSSLIKSCGWIFPFETTCLVCDHPTILSFDEKGKLHSEKDPAIEFADGFSIYINHGEVIRDVFPLL